MSTQNDFFRTFVANTAMSAFRRVSISSNGQVDLAAATVPGAGVIQADNAGNAFEEANVRLYGTGTCKISSTGGVITAGNAVFAAANGQITTSGTVTIGYAVQAATASGDIIEVLALPQF